MIQDLLPLLTPGAEPQPAIHPAKQNRLQELVERETQDRLDTIAALSAITLEAWDGYYTNEGTEAAPDQEPLQVRHMRQLIKHMGNLAGEASELNRIVEDRQTLAVLCNWREVHAKP